MIPVFTIIFIILVLSLGISLVVIAKPDYSNAEQCQSKKWDMGLGITSIICSVLSSVLIGILIVTAPEVVMFMP